MQDTIFKDIKIDFDKLLLLGFKKENNYYIYNENIMDNKFKLIIKIDKNNIITSDVIDTSINDKYILYYVNSVNGKFVSMIREYYNKVINNIKDNCTNTSDFKYKYTNLVIKYIKDKYGDELEFLWEKYPKDGIWRNKENKKWYGVLLSIEKGKLEKNDAKEIIEIIDLQLEPEKLEKIIDNKKYFQGYHMNKKHWITIKLDGSTPLKEIYQYIDNSYKISINKK